MILKMLKTLFGFWFELIFYPQGSDFITVGGNPRKEICYTYSLSNYFYWTFLTLLCFNYEMKKYFAIQLRALFLLQWCTLLLLHTSAAENCSHKDSVTGKRASCGMESNGKLESSSETRITVHCCDNELPYTRSIMIIARLCFILTIWNINAQESLFAPETSHLSKYASLTNFTNG